MSKQVNMSKAAEAQGNCSSSSSSLDSNEVQANANVEAIETQEVNSKSAHQDGPAQDDQQQPDKSALGSTKPLVGSSASTALASSSGCQAINSDKPKPEVEVPQEENKTRVTRNSISAPSQQKQMFSLKQLALQSRNLTTGKKRGSLEPVLSGNDENQQTTSALASKQFPFKLKVQQGEWRSKREQQRQLKSWRHQTREHANELTNQSNSSDEEKTDNKQSREDKDSDQEFEYSDSDEMDSKHQDEFSTESSLDSSTDQSYHSSSNENGSTEIEAIGQRTLRLDETRRGTSLDEQMKRNKQHEEVEGKDKTSKRARRRRRRLRKGDGELRRGSNCQCEPIISRIEADGQPVTDVDYVTYKHLCHLEQKQQQIRANNVKNRNTGCTGQIASTFNHLYRPSIYGDQVLSSTSSSSRSKLKVGTRNEANLSRPATSATQQTLPIRPGQLGRRSSLQEESGAYYQLCTSTEEQQIRQKYVWWPPSLKSLQLVDRFFAHFSPDKVPFAVAVNNDKQSKEQNLPLGQDKENSAISTKLIIKDKLQAKNSGTDETGNQKPIVSANFASSHPASSPACSYRDEQISFQLPRQDISLDYCSYHLDEQSRSNYLHFISKRNGQALEVASVVQILPQDTQLESSFRGGNQTKGRGLNTSQRKLSSSSQFELSAVVSSTKAIGRHQQALTQRCRRCLVRFETNQLAVVAPNFAIGTGGVIQVSDQHHHHNRPQQQKQQQTGAIDAASDCSGSGAASRRSSLSGNQTALNSSLGTNLTSKPNLALFHPQCFACSTCKEFLVDLVYCLRDNRLYCLRHYGESLRPRCNWCQEVSSLEVESGNNQTAFRSYLNESTGHFIWSFVLFVPLARHNASLCGPKQNVTFCRCFGSSNNHFVIQAADKRNQISDKRH